MVLAYLIKPLEIGRLTAYVFRADIAVGSRLGREKYPHQPMSLLKTPPDFVRLTPLDRKILMAMVMNSGHMADSCVFSGTAAFAVVENMIETHRCYLWPGGSLPLARKGVRSASPVWLASGADGLFKPSFDVAEGETVLPTAPPLVIGREGAICQSLKTGFPDELALRWQRSAPLDHAKAIAFVERLASDFPAVRIPAPPGIEETVVGNAIPIPVLTMSREAGGKAGEASLLLRLTFRYGGREIEHTAVGDEIRYMDGNRMMVMTRAAAEESAAVARLTAFGLTPFKSRSMDMFGRQTEQGALTLTAGGAPTWSDVVSALIPDLQAAGWEIRHADGCRLVAVTDEDWYSDFSEASRGWLAFESGIRVGDKRVNLLPFIHRFLRDHRDWTEAQITAAFNVPEIPVVAEDCIVLVPGSRLLAMVRQLFELYSDDALDRESRLRVDEWRAVEISRQAPGVTWEPPPALAELVRSLDQDLTIVPQPAPPGMAAVLRTYQEYGVGWLRFLDDHRLGGILADDMGLGKTIQVIALLQVARNEGRLDLPALVVAPVSVLPNWGNELKRFAPGLKVALLHGGERHRHWEDLSGNDVVLTSYALLRLDIRMFASHPFSFVILDEAQAIKNPKAQVARAACLVNGRTRLCLTGTPVENHLGDLWSLMHFALPGVLGQQERFEQCFRRPIERDQHPVMLSQLQRRVTPLILRRTKNAVAADLPAKTEIIQTIPLSDVQHDLYQAVRLAMTERIRQEMETKGLERSRIIVLAALLKLRQTCCDPRLSDKRRKYNIPEDSGKLAWLADVLPEMVEEGRRILLFSQFTSMLDLIRLQLQEMSIPFVEIRGSTKDRGTPVRQFQEGQVPVFLLSLKAGGTGLNLTAADTVIHYDPWWNPAVEAQATDRAHRIGQDKPVFVYKLVTEKTVEERILELQKSKRSLSDLISTTGGDSLAFTKEILDALLAPV